MTDYNDGEWHNSNGDYPEDMHPQSLVTFVWHNERTGKYGMEEYVPAGRVTWSRVLKFRVTKPFGEPRVIWVNEYEHGRNYAHPTEEEARKLSGPDATRIAVRYVEAPE